MDISAVDATCDTLFLIFDEARHNGWDVDLKGAQEHIEDCVECFEVNSHLLPAKPVGGYRWIMYLYQPMGQSFELARLRNLSEAKEALIRYGKETGFYQDLQVGGQYGCSGSLYPYSREDWIEAKRFEDVGNPFDYPSKLVENGPRGGVRITNA